MYDFYLAGPFFNEPQVRFLEAIKTCAERAGKTLWTPHTAKRLGPSASEGEAWAVYLENLKKIDEARGVIAVLDWLQPAHQRLVVVTEKTDPVPARHEMPVLMPDTGTVFEMGYAEGKTRPVYGVYMRQPRRLNVMLAQSCVKVALWDEMTWDQFFRTENDDVLIEVKPEVF